MRKSKIELVKFDYTIRRRLPITKTQKTKSKKGTRVKET